MQLDYSKLNTEYIAWSIDIGDGRNKNDIRFGQYIHNKYDMTSWKTDVFYDESCERSYSRILSEMHERELKNQKLIK